MTSNFFKTTIFITIFSLVTCSAQQPAPADAPVVSAPMVPPPAQPANPEMRGCIKMAGLPIALPQFRVLFGEGKETMSNNEGFFTFPLDSKQIDHYSLVICKRIRHNFDKKNTLKNVGVIPDKDYRYFTYHKIGETNRWYQQEERLSKDNYILPAQCITVLIDPKNVESIEPWKIDLPSHIIKLPTIVLKNTLEQKKLARVSAKSLLYSLDNTTFHESVREENKPQEKNAKVHISRVQ